LLGPRIPLRGSEDDMKIERSLGVHPDRISDGAFRDDKGANGSSPRPDLLRPTTPLRLAEIRESARPLIYIEAEAFVC
jgi:hypothetical protein